LAKLKSRDFGIEKKLEEKNFGYTLIVTLLSTPATMLQVATAFFHSWLTKPIATNERYQG